MKLSNKHHPQRSGTRAFSFTSERVPRCALLSLVLPAVVSVATMLAGQAREEKGIEYQPPPFREYLDIALPEGAGPFPAVVVLHGGGFRGGNRTDMGEFCRRLAESGFAAVAVDYRMPPEHPYPAALDDCVAAYRYILERHAPDDIVVGGRSAGGNLAAALMLRARDEGLPMPSGLVLLSPQADLTESGDSFETNRMVDVVLPGSLMSSNLLYANGADLKHPYVSPLFGDLKGLPATFLQTGTRDLFLSNTVRMHRALIAAGVKAELHVFEAMPHGGFMGGTPEDRELQEAVSRFVQDRWACTIVHAGE